MQAVDRNAIALDVYKQSQSLSPENGRMSVSGWLFGVCGLSRDLLLFHRQATYFAVELIVGKAETEHRSTLVAQKNSSTHKSRAA